MLLIELLCHHLACREVSLVVDEEQVADTILCVCDTNSWMEEVWCETVEESLLDVNFMFLSALQVAQKEVQ